MKMTEKPVWLLDVDGVINALVRRGDYPMTWPEESWRLIEIQHGFKIYPIQYSTEVIDFINKMSGRVEIRWHTTWQRHAIHLGTEVGLELFSVQPSPEFDGFPGLGWWKLQAAVRVARDEGRVLIWTDDDLNSHHAHQFWSELDDEDDFSPPERYIDDPRALLIRPMGETGLRKENFDAIEAFVERHEND